MTQKTHSPCGSPCSGELRAKCGQLFVLCSHCPSWVAGLPCSALSLEIPQCILGSGIIHPLQMGRRDMWYTGCTTWSCLVSGVWMVREPSSGNMVMALGSNPTSFGGPCWPSQTVAFFASLLSQPIESLVTCLVQMLFLSPSGSSLPCE